MEGGAAETEYQAALRVVGIKVELVHDIIVEVSLPASSAAKHSSLTNRYVSDQRNRTDSRRRWTGSKNRLRH